MRENIYLRQNWMMLVVEEEKIDSTKYHCHTWTGFCNTSQCNNRIENEEKNDRLNHYINGLFSFKHDWYHALDYFVAVFCIQSSHFDVHIVVLWLCWIICH